MAEGGSRRRGDRERRRRDANDRRRERLEEEEFDPAPPGEGDYTVPDLDRLRRIRAPERLSGVLEEVARRQGWTERIRGTPVLSRWRQVVGDDLAARCEPVRLAGGILIVRARSQAWATELGYLRGQIRARANALLGEELVEEVQVVVGKLSGGSEGDR